MSPDAPSFLSEYDNEFATRRTARLSEIIAALGEIRLEGRADQSENCSASRTVGENSVDTLASGQETTIIIHAGVGSKLLARALLGIVQNMPPVLTDAAGSISWGTSYHSGTESLPT